MQSDWLDLIDCSRLKELIGGYEQVVLQTKSEGSSTEARDNITFTTTITALVNELLV